MSDWRSQYAPAGKRDPDDQTNYLSLDGRDGLFYVYRQGQKTPIGHEIWIAMVALRHVRTLFAEPYKKGRSPIIACSSWNGRDAFGLGRRPERGEHDWMSSTKAQNCVGCPTGEWVGKEKPECDKQTWALVMWRTGDDHYTLEPAWLRAKSRFASLLDRTFADLAGREQADKEKTYHRVIQVVSEADGDYYAQKLGLDSYKIEADRAKKLDAWVEANAHDMWKQDMEKGERKARTRFSPEANDKESKPQTNAKSKGDEGFDNSIPF
jgi:hypothetical protein